MSDKNKNGAGKGVSARKWGTENKWDWDHGFGAIENASYSSFVIKNAL